MTRSTRWSPARPARHARDRSSPRAGTAASPSPAPRPRRRSQPRRPASRPAPTPFDGDRSTPPTGDAPCGTAAVHRRVQEDLGARRQDRRVPAVHAGRGVPVEDRVQRLRHPGQRLSRRQHAAGQGRTSTSRTAPGPTSSRAGTRAAGSSSSANADYWGTKALTAEPRVPLERPGRPAARSSSSPAPSTASTTPAPTTSTTDQGRRRRSRSTPREGLNTFYVGFNNTIAPWTTRTSARRSPWASTASRSSTTSTREGSEVATHFTPCAIPFGCEGDDLVRLRRRRGQAAPDRRRASTSARPTRSSSAPRSAATCPIRPQIATEIQSQLKANLGINDHARPPGVGRVPRRQRRGQARRPLPPRLGRRLSGSDQLPRLPLRRRARARSSASPFDDIVAALNKGGQSADDAARKAAYAEANNLIKQHVPVVIDRPRRLRHGLQGRRHGRPLVAAQQRDLLGDEGRRPRHRWSGCRTPSRSACTAATSRTARPSAPASRSTSRSTPTRSAAPRSSRRSPPSASRTPTLTVWTCTLRDGVKFHDGADARRQRRRRQLRRPVGREAPAPRRPVRRVRVLPRPVRRLPEPAAAVVSLRPRPDLRTGRRHGGAPFVHHRPAVRLTAGPPSSRSDAPDVTRFILRRLLVTIPVLFGLDLPRLLPGPGRARRPVPGRPRREGHRRDRAPTSSGATGWTSRSRSSSASTSASSSRGDLGESIKFSRPVTERPDRAPADHRRADARGAPLRDRRRHPARDRCRRSGATRRSTSGRWSSPTSASRCPVFVLGLLLPVRVRPAPEGHALRAAAVRPAERRASSVQPLVEVWGLTGT